MSDLGWISSAIGSARPQAMGALLRYFRNLDTAEEAFQDACLRALKNWPQNGPPRDPAAWLIMVGRNAAIDEVRRDRKQVPLPPDETISDLDDAETELAERLGNTRAVCRKCYIHPAVLEAWSDGKLLEEMTAANRRKRGIAGLDDEEALVLRWLETRKD